MRVPSSPRSACCSFLQPLDAPPQVCGGLGVGVNLAQVAHAEEAELRRGDGTRSDGVEHQGLPDRIAVRPFGVRGQQPELLDRGSIAAGDEKELLFVDALVEQQRGEDSRVGIEEEDFDQRRTAAFGRSDLFAEGELLDASEEESIDRPSHRRRNFHIDGHVDEVRPVEVVDQLDRVGLRRLPVLDQSKADRVEAGETLGLGDGLEDGRRDVASDQLFTIGLLSLADALLDAPLEMIIRELPLAEEISAALLERSGAAGSILDAAISYERGEFDAVSLEAHRGRVAPAYRDALGWARSTVAQAA